MKGKVKMEKKILLDQIGFTCNAVKKAVTRDNNEGSFQIYCKRQNKEIMCGKLNGPLHNEQADEDDYVADFSQITDPGEYEIRIGQTKESFIINDDIYHELYEKALHFYYLQRCGSNLPAKYAGVYSHPACHDTEAVIYGTKEKRKVNGGWHDAGDYGRYVVAAAVTVADLLLAYEDNKNTMGISFQIPESGGAMPDLLCEIKYELDWMLKMQDEVSGEVYHKVSCASFHGFDMPETEKEELVISPVSVTATATFAAVMAMSAAFYEDYNEKFSRELLQAAQRAYAAQKKMNIPGGFKNPEGVVTGAYDDANDIDERYWAAAALYKATGKKEYRDDFEALAKQGILHGYGWEDNGSFGNLAYLSTEYSKDSELEMNIKDSMIQLAEQFLQNSLNDSYAVALEDYKWGSNFYVAQIGNHLYDAYKMTGRKEFKEAASEQLHYLLGKNPNGFCYVTGFGNVSPIHPHHRPSEAMHSAVPGMLVGGPDQYLHDPDAVEYCTGKAPAKCYIDVLGSYSTNEITIYWNSALLYLMAVLS